MSAPYGWETELLSGGRQTPLSYRESTIMYSTCVQVLVPKCNSGISLVFRDTSMRIRARATEPADAFFYCACEGGSPNDDVRGYLQAVA